MPFPVLALIAALGTVTSMQGQQNQAQAEHDAAVYNARLATMQAEEEARRIRTTGRITQSINLTRIGKSGVRVSGSPLDVLVNNSYQVARQASNAIRAGEAADRLLRMEAKNATKAGQYAMGSSLLQGAGSFLGGSSSTFAGGALPSSVYGANSSPYTGAVLPRRR